MDQQEPCHNLPVVQDLDTIKARDKDLQAATRFYGLATLFAGAAHDLRGPLNSMVVHLELLKQSVRRAVQRVETEEAATQRKYIEIIQQAAYSLNGYLQVMLELAAPAEKSRSQTDLCQVLTEIAGLLRAPAKLQGVALDWQLPEKPVRITCMKVQLRQALLNLIINALEAMPTGGAITVRLSVDDLWLDVEICDKGAGIPDEWQERIFDMHFSTKENRTGIGLYVARSVIEEHNGTIHVHDNPGSGACFHVRLPMTEVASQATS